jgi:putative endonuclease
MFYLYILQSQKDKRTYVGYTADIERRLSEHHSGKVLATKNRRPLKIIKVEAFVLMSEAKKRELYWKSGAGRKRTKDFFKQKCWDK